MINKNPVRSEFNNVVVRGALFAASGNFGFDGGNGVVINGNGVTVNLRRWRANCFREVLIWQAVY
ncbi:hypothetical protein EEPDABAO_00088 [Klebsiella phage mfs]|uniref:Uncharacterized protein n=1 Tax=Klebsiella phage mfs TaxID=2985561 RepID=A0A9X9P1Y7_9CAUD|nr:hypothetical protein EEPDABAO_00088 [Klebsiella phage mfs]